MRDVHDEVPVHQVVQHQWSVDQKFKGERSVL